MLSSLFYNCKWFKGKASAAHHSVIEKDVNALLAKDAIAQSTDYGGVYSNLFEMYW